MIRVQIEFETGMIRVIAAENTISILSNISVLTVITLALLMRLTYFLMYNTNTNFSKIYVYLFLLG